MAIPLTGSQSLFVRWGHELGGSNEVQNLINATLTTRTNLIAADYVSTDQDVIDGLYTTEANFRTTPRSYLTSLQNLMQATLIQMAQDDGTGINPEDVPTALKKLIAQMKTAVASIQKPTTSATITAGSGNTGNGTLMVSLTGPDGLSLDYVIAETLTATCTDDAYTGNATAGQEPFSIVGQVAADSIYSYNYPQGSGSSTAVDTNNPAASGALVTDGDFEVWSGTGNNTPTDWPIIVGTTGTTIYRGTDPYTGSYNLKIVGNGSQLTNIRQDLTGLSPDTVYAFNCWMKTDGSVAAGVMRFALVDGSATVVNDDAGTANSFTKAISALTSSYAPVQAFFRTPSIMPTTISLDIALTTAVTNTEVVALDRVNLVAATPLYSGGPLAAIFGGSTDFKIDDTFSIAIANNATISSFSLQLARYLGLRTLELRVPSASSPTIADGLIV